MITTCSLGGTRRERDARDDVASAGRSPAGAGRSGPRTSWHAANHGAALLRLAGVEAWAVQPDESVLHGPAADRDDALVLLSHRGTKLYTSEELSRAQARG